MPAKSRPATRKKEGKKNEKDIYNGLQSRGVEEEERLDESLLQK